MPVIRILLAGLVALGAVLATVLAAFLILVGGLAAYVLQLFRPKTASRPAFPRAKPARSTVRPNDDVIEVVTTDVRAEKGP
jgi:hypothetical protein